MSLTHSTHIHTHSNVAIFCTHKIISWSLRAIRKRLKMVQHTAYRLHGLLAGQIDNIKALIIVVIYIIQICKKPTAGRNEQLSKNTANVSETGTRVKRAGGMAAMPLQTEVWWWSNAASDWRLEVEQCRFRLTSGGGKERMKTGQWLESMCC